MQQLLHTDSIISEAITDLIMHVANLFILENPISFHSRLLAPQSKKAGKDQELIQSSTAPDPGYQRESDNVSIDITIHNPD